MTDPTRRRILDEVGAASVTTFDVVSPEVSFLVETHHPTKPGVLDFEEFAVGSPDRPGKGRAAFVGFRGRPQLTNALLSEIQARFELATILTLRTVVSALRSFWRFLDSVESFAPVNELGDLQELHGTLWVRAGCDPLAYAVVKGLVADARMERNQLPVLWPPMPERTQCHVDVPDPKHVRDIYHELKFRVRALFRRWEDSDALAAEGVSQRGNMGSRTKSRLMPPDIHATFRDSLATLGKGVAHPIEIRELLGYGGTGHQFPSNWGELSSSGALYSTLYPRRSDIQDCFLLFLCKSGWNPQVALDIDLSDSGWVMPHPITPGRVVISSKKSRGETMQQAVSGTRSEVDIFPMLQKLIARTEPLRRDLERELAHLISVRGDGDQFNQRVVDLQRMIRSPWLAFDNGSVGEVLCLDILNYNATPKSDPYLRVLIRQVNAKNEERGRAGAGVQEPGGPVPETMQSTDLRDAFIANGIVASGFNWLVGRILAGHASAESIRAYIRKRQYRAHSEKQVRKLQNALWSEIENYQIVDGAMLNLMVRNGTVTDEQRQRWLSGKGLTRMGMGCLDPCNPPKELDPGHPSGSVCRVQRCILCHLGVVLEQSLGPLTRRQAELEFLRGVMPIAAWLESSFGDELERLIGTLAKFPADQVASNVFEWREKIESGQLKVENWEGSYG